MGFFAFVKIWRTLFSLKKGSCTRFKLCCNFNMISERQRKCNMAFGAKKTKKLNVFASPIM